VASCITLKPSCKTCQPCVDGFPRSAGCRTALRLSNRVPENNMGKNSGPLPLTSNYPCQNQGNLEEINQRLTQPRPSLSPSTFSERQSLGQEPRGQSSSDDFQHFTRTSELVRKAAGLDAYVLSRAKSCSHSRTGCLSGAKKTSGYIPIPSGRYRHANILQRTR
jgi:hypothetical protein